MFLQQLAPNTNLNLLARALKASTASPGQGFSVVRELGTDTSYLVRGPEAATIASKHTQVIFKPEADLFLAEGERPKPDLYCEVVKTGRGTNIWLSASIAVGSMMAGMLAAVAGVKMMASGGDLFQSLAVGSAVTASGVLAVVSYVRACTRGGDSDVNAAFVKAACTGRVMRIDSVERPLQPRWPRASTMTATEDKPTLALPPPESFDAAFLVVNAPRAKVAV